MDVKIHKEVTFVLARKASSWVRTDTSVKVTQKPIDSFTCMESIILSEDKNFLKKNSTCMLFYTVCIGLLNFRCK